MTARNRAIAFGVYVLLTLVCAAIPVRALVFQALHDDTSSHILVIPFVSAILIFLGRDVIFSVVKPSRLLGAAFILVGAGVGLTAEVLAAGKMEGAPLSAAAAGLVTAWAGGFLWFYGRLAARAALFPLLFLVFMIPVPHALLDAATQFLKQGSADTVAVLFGITHTPFYREGYEFVLPKFAIEIADECSGIRSSIALLLTSLLAGYVFFDESWSRSLLVVAVLPVAILKNGIRIVSLSLLAMYVNPSFLTGRLHHDGGVVFYAIALGLVAPFVILLRKLETFASREIDDSPVHTVS